MKGSVVLPYGSGRYVFAATVAVGCVLATASLAQTIDSTNAGRAPPQEEYAAGGTIRLGGATIDLSHQLFLTDGPGPQTDLTPSREKSSSARFSLDLADRWDSGLFPETLNVTARRMDILGRPQISVGTIENLDQNDQSKSDYMISADWGAPDDKFTFSFSSSFLNERPYTGETADTGDDMLNFTRTLKTGGWLSSFTASIGQGYHEEDGYRERSRKFGAAANFKTLQKDAPQFDITAKVLQDRTTRLAPGSGDVDTKWQLRTDSQILGAVSRDELTTLPSLSIFFSVTGHSPDQEEQGVNTIDFATGVSGKVHF